MNLVFATIIMSLKVTINMIVDMKYLLVMITIRSVRCFEV